MLELYIEVIQLQGKTYFWALLGKDKQYARSSNIDKKEIIMTEALELAETLNLEVVVNERPDNMAEIVRTIYPDLDYDNDLAADAQQFGLDTQGGADVAVHIGNEPASVMPPQIDDKQLVKALRMIQEVYGETNSKGSVLFLDWTDAVLGDVFDERETEALIQGLREDRFCYIARLGRARENEQYTKATWLTARLNATVAACNIVRAVQNKVNGRAHVVWIEKALWRLSLTGADRKGEA